MMIVLAAESKEDHISHLVLDEVSHQYVWVKNAGYFSNFEEADAFVDFNEDVNDYGAVHKPILVNKTSTTLDKFVCNWQLTGRFCGWTGFADRLSWEIGVAPMCDTGRFGELLKAIGKEMILVNDIPGLIAPRVLSVIINEACYAIAEGISDAEQIDIAMKLGTNYPEGPISWGKKIGGKKIAELLNAMAAENERYNAHDSLLNFLS